MGAGGSSATRRNGTTTKTVLMHKQEEEQLKIKRNVHLLSNNGNNKNGTGINSLTRSAEDKDFMSKSKQDKHKNKMTLTPLSSEQRANSANDVINLSTNSNSNYANSVNHHSNVHVNNNSSSNNNSIIVNHSTISANSADRSSSRRQLILLHNRSISRTPINQKYATRSRESKLHHSLVPEPHSKYTLTTAEEEVERVLGGQLCGSAALEALQKINLRKQRVAESGAEEDWSALTRNADSVTLEILQHLHDADRCNSGNSNSNNNNNNNNIKKNKSSENNNNGSCKNSIMEKWNHLHTCEQLLHRVRADQYETLAMMVYTKEGVYFHSQSKLDDAKECYSHAIRIAEQRVARQEKDMYMVLKRYVVAMIGLARIWYEHERDTKGFTFANQHRPYVDKQKIHHSKSQKESTSVNNNGVDDDDEDKETSLSNSSMTSISSIASLESSLSSASGSVFSVNEALLKAVAPRPPRRRVGPMYTRVKLHVPRTLPASALLANRENEFVLHSKMTRELVASPCELLLLRCLEVVEIGHNSHSELLIPPLIELAQIYEDLSLFSRALLLVRRCVGILCSVYDYDHPWIVQLNLRTSRLTKELELQRRALMASKIQATWKMYRQMCAYEDMVHHPIRRHVHIARKYNIMHTNRVINSVNGTSNVPNGYGSLKNATMTMISSIVPSVVSTPFVLSSKGVEQATIINNNNSGSPGIIHNQAPDFLGTYMDGVPINSVINGEQTKHNNNNNNSNNKSSDNKMKTNRVLELSASELSNSHVTSETSSVFSQHEEVLLQEQEEKYEEQEQEPMESLAWSKSKETVSDNTNNVKNAEDAEHVQESVNAHGVHYDEGSDVNNRVFVPPVTTYLPMEKSGEVNAVTTMVPNAKVIGTTQDTSTDTLLHQTTQGPVLTICTTTVTQTVTEKVLSSDDDDEEEEEEENEEEEDEDEEVVEVDDEDNV